MLLPDTATALGALTAVVLSLASTLEALRSFERGAEALYRCFPVRQGHTSNNDLAAGNRVGRAVPLSCQAARGTDQRDVLKEDGTLRVSA